MKILAIESSCDETAAAVIRDGREIISSVVATQIDEHKLYGGVVPEIASRRHCESIVGVVNEALEKAGKTAAEIDAIAVTYAPGLIGALLVGVNFAKGLAFSLNKPLIPVHHIRGHIAAMFFFCTDSFEQYGCRLVIWVLRNEFSSDCEVKYFLTKFLCIHYSSMFAINFCNSATALEMLSLFSWIRAISSAKV